VPSPPIVPSRLESEPSAPAPAQAGPSPSDPAQAGPSGPAGASPRRPALVGAQRIALVGLFALGTLAALHAGRTLLLPVLIAVLLSLLLSPAVSLLERMRLPRWLAALLVVAGSVAMAAGLAMHLSAPAQHWMDAGPEPLEELRRKLRLLREPVEAVRGATDRVAELASDQPANPREVVVTRRWSSVLVDNAQPIAIGTASVLILLYFLLASGDLFLRKLIRITPRLRDKVRAIEISRSVQQEIARYFASITLINVGLGSLVALTMGVLGMPTPVLLGTVAALLNFVPYLGSLIALVLMTLVATLSFDTLGEIVLPPAAFFLLTTLEGQVVQPLVLGRQLSTAPVVVFLWVLFWGWLWGFGGVAVAIPMLVAVKLCAEQLPSWQPLAELLGRD